MLWHDLATWAPLSSRATTGASQHGHPAQGQYLKSSLILNSWYTNTTVVLKTREQALHVYPNYTMHHACLSLLSLIQRHCLHHLIAACTRARPSPFASREWFYNIHRDFKSTILPRFKISKDLYNCARDPPRAFRFDVLDEISCMGSLGVVLACKTMCLVNCTRVVTNIFGLEHGIRYWCYEWC
jgi:hypothetical protein